MDQGNCVCAMCHTNTPNVFCQCTTPEVFLCMGCLGKHVINNTRKEHATRPIEELPYYKIPGYFTRLDTRKATFPRVKEQAWKTVGEVDRALEEYNRAVEWVIADYSARVEDEVRDLQQRVARLVAQAENAISDLRAQATEQVAKLNSLKTELVSVIQNALSEVERTIAEDKPQLSSQYAPEFRQFTETAQSFHLFSFQIQTSPQPAVTLTSHLQESIQASPSRAPPVELAQVTDTYIRFFNCQNSAWGPQIFLHSQIKADSTSSWAVLEDKRLFCSGGGSEC